MQNQVHSKNGVQEWTGNAISRTTTQGYQKDVLLSPRRSAFSFCYDSRSQVELPEVCCYSRLILDVHCDLSYSNVFLWSIETPPTERAGRLGIKLRNGEPDRSSAGPAADSGATVRSGQNYSSWWQSGSEGFWNWHRMISTK